MILFYLLIWGMPLSQHHVWARFFGELTVIKYLGTACLLYSLIHVAARGEIPAFFRTKSACWFALLYLVATISYWSKGASQGWEMSPFMSYTAFLLLFIITLAVVDSLERLRGTLLIAIGSVAFASLYVLREYQKYHTIYIDFRPGWVVGDSNYFAASALLCLPLAFYLAREDRFLIVRWFCFGCLIVTLAAMILAASRGGFVGLLAAFIVVVWRSSQRFRNLAIVAGLLLPLLMLAPASPLQRFLHPSHGDEEAVHNRTIVWKAAWRMVELHPWAGVGLGNFKANVVAYEDQGEIAENIAHNAYLEIAAELGLPALLIFLSLLISVFITLEKVYRLTGSGSSLLKMSCLGIQAGLVGFAVSNCFVSGQYQKLFWLMLFLSMSMPALTEHARKRREVRMLEQIAPVPEDRPCPVEL